MRARILFAVFLLTLAPKQAFACGWWDHLCQLREMIKNPTTILTPVPPHALAEFKEARSQVSKALDKVDPRITQMGRDFDRWRLNFTAQVLSGPALAAWITQSRNDAYNGSSPIPDKVKAAMAGWYTPQQMSEVRFKIGDGGSLNLGSLSTKFGERDAITLIDVIVFRNANVAEDYSTWAHELKHVTQYQDWGVQSFATQYMQSWNSVEDPAYAIGAQFAKAQEAGEIASASPGQKAALSFGVGAIVITMLDATGLQNTEVGGGLAGVYGSDVLHNRPPYDTNRENAARFDFSSPMSGQFDLYIEYAAGQPRPIEVSLNSDEFQSALEQPTGGWDAQQWTKLWTVTLNEGPNNIRLRRNNVFPHVRKIAFLPIQQ